MINNVLQKVLKRINISPLGAGALAGTTFPIDRAIQCGTTWVLMVFMKIVLDAVSDRDFILEFHEQ